MKKLTMKPSATNLLGFKKEDRLDYDGGGNGILHHLVISNAPLVSIQDAIMRLKCSPHVFNKDFKSPIDIAIENGQRTSQFEVAQFLLEQPLQVDDEFLDYMLGTLVNKCTHVPSESEITIGFFASRLCGVDVHVLFNDNRDKYKGHIQWFKGTGVTGQNLEGFWVDKFLPLRIRSMLDIFTREYLSKPVLAQAQITRQRIKEIKAEIKRDLQTLWIIRYGEKIVKLIAPQQIPLLQGFHRGMVESIKNMPEKQSMILDAGWKGHALYLQIKKVANDQYQLMVHNLGEGNDVHPQGASSSHRYPYMLGILTHAMWDASGVGFSYLEVVMQNSFPSRDINIMRPIVYKKVSAVGLDHTLFKALPAQLVGNCVVANHDAAQHVAMDPTVCDWLQTRERALVGGLNPHKMYAPIPFDSLWSLNIVRLFSMEMTYPVGLQEIKWKELTIEKLIGKGNFSKVYLGKWQGSEVAVKRLNKDMLNVDGMLLEDANDDFKKEANIHAQCSHHNIVRLFGITREPGHFALTMEYCQNGSLHELLHKPSVELPWETRWEIALDVGHGLAYLHDTKGILHRDLKSLNVVLDERFRAKITDLGQSKLKLLATTTGNVKQTVGTIKWRAPETFEDPDYEFTPSADVYSYGMILWEIATRREPFASSQNDAQTIGFITKRQFNKTPSDCPPAFAAVIQDTRKEAGERPTATDICKTLETGRPALPKPVIVAPPLMPAINQSQVNQLLQHVAYGEQDQAEALIKTNPNLLLGKGTVTDYSGRTFNNITPFQYALWAYDWHLWTMLTKYLPPPAAQAQLRGLEAQSTAHGTHYDFNPLLSAYKTYIDNYDPWYKAKNWDVMKKHLKTVIGKLQTQVPANVAQEYCRTDRSFKPTPSFKEPSLKRTFKLYRDEGVWYPLEWTHHGFLGVGFGVLRYNFFRAGGAYGPTYSECSVRTNEGGPFLTCLEVDFSAVAKLCKVRTAQYEELKALLR